MTCRRLNLQSNTILSFCSDTSELHQWCLVISKKTKFREKETSPASVNIYVYARTTKSRIFFSLYQDFECFLEQKHLLVCLEGFFGAHEKWSMLI